MCVLLTQTQHPQKKLTRIEPHARTLRKAREQVKLMVTDGFSTQKIRRYLNRWTHWWVSTSETWQYSELLMCLGNSCWDIRDAATAAALQEKFQRNVLLQH